MKQGSSAVGWFLDRLLRLSAAATALSLMLGMIAAFIVFKPATFPGLIAALVSMLFGFIVAIFLIIASFSFWPDKSAKLKTPALILLSMIYISGATGVMFAAAGTVTIAYAKSLWLSIPARTNEPHMISTRP